MCFFSALFLFVRKKNKGSRKRKDRSRKFIGMKCYNKVVTEVANKI